MRGMLTPVDKISFLNIGSFEGCQPLVIETGSLHRLSYHLIDSFAHSVAINRNCCISVDDPVDGEERAVSSTGKYFEKSLLFARVDHLINRYLSLDHLQVERLFNVIFHIQDRLAHHPVHDTGVCWRSD